MPSPNVAIRGDFFFECCQLLYPMVVLRKGHDHEKSARRVYRRTYASDIFDPRRHQIGVKRPWVGFPASLENGLSLRKWGINMTRLARIFGLILGALLVVAPLNAQAVNPFTYFIQVANPNKYDAWITIYSLGKVRIERYGRVAANSSVNFEDNTFSPGSYHHVRFEWMLGKRVLCDTSVQMVITKSEYRRGGTTT